MPPLPQSPQDYDVVLGGQTNLPLNALVLGGLEGVRHRLTSPVVAQRIAAIAEARHQGKAGLEGVIQALQDDALAVQKAAYQALHQWPAPEAEAALQAYDAYPIFECLQILTGHAGGITAIALSQDGETVVSGGRDCTVRVWDWQAGEVIWEFPVNTLIYAVAVSPDGQTVAMRDRQQQIQAWYLRNGQAIEPDDLQLRSIPSVIVSQGEHRTSRHLISGSQNTIKIWDLKAGRECCLLRGHTSLVTAVASHATQPLLVSGSQDRTIRIWGVA
jgi:WD domain, G-beta repeat